MNLAFLMATSAAYELFTVLAADVVWCCAFSFCKLMIFIIILNNFRKHP